MKIQNKNNLKVFFNFPLGAEWRFSKLPPIKIAKKKSQTALTLTWFAAVIVIFFIMLLFIVLTSYLTGKKVLSGEENSIQITTDLSSGDLGNQRDLMRLLNSPAENNKDIKNLILEWKFSNSEETETEIKKEVKNLLDNYGDKCYFFSVDYPPENSMNDYILISKTKFSFYDRTISDDVLELFKKSSGLDFFSNQQKINVKLYTGKC